MSWLCKFACEKNEMFTIIKHTILCSSHCNYSAERPWANSHCNNRAIVCVVWMEGTNGNAGGVSAQLKHSSCFLFSDIHSVLTNVSIWVLWWLPLQVYVGRVQCCPCSVTWVGTWDCEGVNDKVSLYWA